MKDDAGLFAQVYERHSRDVLVFLTRRTWDPELALDLTAETFAQAFAGRRRYRGTSDEERAAWLFGIARHVLSRAVRKGRAEQRALRRLGVEVPELEPADAARIIELAGLEHLRGAVARGLEDLADDQRQAVRLRVVEQLSYAEVATTLGISEPAARTRVSRALRALGSALDRTTEGSPA